VCVRVFVNVCAGLYRGRGGGRERESKCVCVISVSKYAYACERIQEYIYTFVGVCVRV